MVDDTSHLVLAIDPGFDRVGWAVGSKVKGVVKALEWGLIQTSKKESASERYKIIITQLETIIIGHQPTEVAIESLFFSNNQKTALQVSEARGIILGVCLKQGLTWYEYNPGQIKLASTGYGRADKNAIKKMMQLTLKIDAEDLIDDTVDALALMMCHLTSLSLGKTAHSR